MRHGERCGVSQVTHSSSISVPSHSFRRYGIVSRCRVCYSERWRSSWFLCVINRLDWPTFIVCFFLFSIGYCWLE